MIEIILVILITCFLIACSFEFDDTNWYHIKKGDHFCKTINRTRAIKFTGKATYVVKFDKSCLYDPTQVGDHINKLCGFTDANSGVHDNSVRFGWRPDMASDKIKIFTYWYVNKQRGYEYLGSVNVDELITLDLLITKSSYKFTFASINYATVLRQKNNKIGVYTRLFPYFGGTPVAPHDMKIYLKEI